MAPRFKFGKNKRKSEEQADISITSSEQVNQKQPISPIRQPQNLKEPAMIDKQFHAPVTGYSQPDVQTPQIDKYSVMATSPWRRYKLFDSPFPRYRHAASSISSEKNEMFFMGGLKEGSVFGDTWKIIPQETRSGDVKTYKAINIEVVNLNNPPARVGHSAVLCGNAFIVYGGDTVDTDFNGHPDNNFYLFNINNNKYTIPSHILNKPNGRYGHTIGAISLNNNSSRLYLYGGQLENNVYSDLYYFELNSFKSPKAKWELVEPANNFKPPPLTNHSMSIDKTKIYIFGGVYNNEKVSNDLWSFDVLSNKWTQVPTTGNIPLPVNEHSSCIVDNKLYIYGGNDFSGIIYNSLYVLNLQTLVWSKISDSALADGPGPRCGHSMTYFQKYNRLVIMGGDKNDYVTNDPTDYETYEEFNGEEVGTMIYELDLNTVQNFLVDIPLNISKLAAKKLAANASTSKQNRETHRKSLSAGIDDFRTPEGSPKIIPQEVYQPQDKFVEVDVPSGTISDDNYDTENDLNIAQSELPDPEIQITNGSSPPSHNKGLAVIPDELKDKPTRLDNNPTQILGGAPESFETRSKGIISHTNGHSDDSKVKKMVTELGNELLTLKATTKTQMQNATEEINKLRLENQSSRLSHQEELTNLQKQLDGKDSIIEELKLAIDPKEIEIDDDKDSKGIPRPTVSELTKYKIDRLETRNKLIYLEDENSKLNEKLAKFLPFMNNQINNLSDFQKIIKAQEEKIANLSSQVRDQEYLQKDINEWKAKFENVEIEFSNYKSIHSDVEIFYDEVQSDNSADSSNQKDISISSTGTTGRISKRDISSHLENLVQLWSTRDDGTSRGIKESIELNNDENPIVTKLQKQVDDLLRISKQNEMDSSAEIANLKKELNSKLEQLKTFEINYRDALQSVNNNSKALRLTQDELNNQRTTIEKLINENNELKLFKKASKRHSSKNSISNDIASPDTSLGNSKYDHATAADDDNHDVDDYDDVDGGLTSAHFSIKVKDLEADVYVLKQERDQLKENVASLQKQLYLVQNSH